MTNDAWKQARFEVQIRKDIAVSTKIIGAGLAGLIAATQFQTAHVIEASSKDTINHKSVLRFRSSAVGDAVGIEFRKVTVRKGLWHHARFQQPTIQLANWYSQKVIGRVEDRSIWNLDAVQRFIAPNDLIEQLIERCNGRISWNTQADSSMFGSEDVISTIPMPALAKLLGKKDLPEFKHAGIFVKRFTISNCDTFETIYFSEPGMSVYRASITADMLIVEAMQQPTELEIDEVLWAFGITREDVVSKESVRQNFGKIAPTDNTWRRGFILEATLQHRIFSLGRYATWRPGVLLDDVLHDIAVIKKMLTGDAYTVRRHA